MFKIVLMPIRVPNSEFCWGKASPDPNVHWVHCDHFSNEGGHSHCALDFYPQRSNKEGYVLKPKECFELKGN